MMKNKQKKLVMLASMIICTGLTACSDDNITDVEKHQFEREFSKKCVERELKNSVNKEEDGKRFKKSCDCIARQMKGDLTDTEADKFLDENKNTQSLRIRFDEAAYECLQENKPVKKGIKVFKNP